jgi:hypothetical protein
LLPVLLSAGMNRINCNCIEGGENRCGAKDRPRDKGSGLGTGVVRWSNSGRYRE